VSDEGTTVTVPGAPEPDEPNGAAEETRTRAPIPVASLNDPHLQVAARNPRRTELIIEILFGLGILCFAAFGAVYWVDIGNFWSYGLTLGLGFFFLGVGLTAWGKYLMPQGPFVEERHELRSSDADRAALSAALVQRTDVVVRRRGVLGGLLAAGLAVFGITALFPLLRSLGPNPGTALQRTNWKKNSLLVDTNGRPIHRDDLEPGGLVTVFPQGYENDPQAQAYDQTVLMRPQYTSFTTKPGRGDWTPAGYVAYSKICTHLGCPVGLYEQQLQLLVCPCHQSMFNIYKGAYPQFGPAARPLPQLPLKIDSAGYLRAQRSYNQPVGPSFWERTTRPQWHW